MLAPAEAGGSTSTPPPLLVRMKKPLPRAIQLVLAIVWCRSKYSTTTTTATDASTKTIEDLGVDSFFLWFKLIFLPIMLIVFAAGVIYSALCDDCSAGREVISRPGGFCFLAVAVLLCIYLAALQAAGGHLGLFAPRTPVAACEAFDNEGMVFIVAYTSVGFMLLVFLDQAWPLLFAWVCLLGLLIASVVAFWLCLLRTYGDGDSSCGETVIDGLAYLYCRLLYEYAVRFHAVADADSGMQQQLLHADVAVV